MDMMNNTSTDDKLCFLSTIPEEITQFKLSKISYTMFNTLRCPLKYYINYVLGIRDYNKYTIIGVITHLCYETELLKYKNGTYNPDTIFDFVTDDFLIETFDSQYNKIDFDAIKPVLLKQKPQIFKTVKNYLSKSFIVNLIELIEKEKYEIGIEIENKDKYINILNSSLLLYTRSDIILYNDKNVEIYDIKCGDINLDYKNQLIFYAYNFINASNLEIPMTRGYIYSAKYKKLKCIFVDEYETINSDFNSLINKIDTLYESLGITTARHIKYYIETQIPTFQESKLIDIYNKLIDINGVTLCKHCKLVYICPFKLGAICNDFTRLISSNNERLVGLKVTEEQKEIII